MGRRLRTTGYDKEFRMEMLKMFKEIRNHGTDIQQDAFC